MISGGGRTLKNLHDRATSGRLAARIVLVIASRECAGADWAREHGIPVCVVPGRIPRDRLESLLREHQAHWVVLAGYLNLVDIPDSFARRVVNIHPALLPRFGGPGMFGKRVHEAVIAAGERESGCTVHLCDQKYDTGPIILQRRCTVEPGDTPDTLAARVFDLELKALPEALNTLFRESAT
jgi:phosphoribosylglycinamide formyltransferase-1